MRPRTQYQGVLTHSQQEEISYSFSFCHLGVPHNWVILCCHMLQLHKTNNLFTRCKDHKETRECELSKSSFVHDQHKWGDRPSLGTPLLEVPAGLTHLSARTGSVTLGKGIFVGCGSAPGCEVDGSLTWVQLWLQFSRALKSHWLCFSETHLCLQSPSGWTAPGIEHNASFDLSGDAVSFKHILKTKTAPEHWV